MSTTKEDLAHTDLAQLISAAVEPLLRDMDRRFTLSMEQQLRPMNQRLDDLDRRVSAMSENLTSLDGRLQQLARTVNAIETAPAPYGKPKTFHSATEFHSVSAPKRVKQGYQG